jgi:hypothetical protein
MGNMRLLKINTMFVIKITRGLLVIVEVHSGLGLNMLTLSSRLLEDSKQKILLVYILCSLGVEITEFHFGVLRTDTEPNTSMLPFGNSRP